MARHRFKTVRALLDAMEAAGVADRAMSPGGVANHLGISRQALNGRIARGLHDTWQTRGVVLVDPVPTRELGWVRRKHRS